MYIIPHSSTTDPRHVQRLFPAPIKRLQRINLSNTRGLAALALGAVLISGLADAVVAVFPEPNKADILAGDALTTLGRHQVLGDVFQVGLDTCGAQLAIVTELAQLVGVVFEVALQLLALDQLLTDLTSTGFLDGKACDGAKTVGHTVAEGVDLAHLKVVGLDFVAMFGLTFDDLGQDGFVVFGGGEGGGLVLSVLVCWDDERERHAGLAATAGSSDAVCVGFGGCGEVEVQNAGHILEVDTTRDTIVLFFRGELATLVRAIRLALVIFGLFVVTGSHDTSSFLLLISVGVLGLLRLGS